jgi:hypothetical protein
MIVVDPGDPIAGDLIDAGDTASPPTNIFESAHFLDGTPVAGVLTPLFLGVNPLEVINPDRGLALYVRAGATATTVTVQVPGVQPYTGAARDDVTIAGLQNAERVFYIPDLLTDPTSEVATVTYSQTVDVTAALFKVN